MTAEPDHPAASPAAVGILAGLRVVEVSAFISAPLGGATLATLGADVIRVDPLGGGPDRNRWPLHQGRSLYWNGLNRGKRSLAIDLNRPAGQELVSRLITAPGPDRGFLITNLEEREWLTQRVLRRQRSDVVVVRIEGNRDGSPAVDYTVNAATGFPWITGPSSAQGPVNHVLPAWDCMTGFLAAIALLAADRHRRLTGSGQEVRISLADVALAVSSHLGVVAEAELALTPRPRLGNDIFGSFGRDFRTRDGRFVMVAAVTRRQWRSLIEASGLQETIAALELRLGTDLLDEDNRFEHREPISRLLGNWFSEHDYAEVSFRLSEHRALWGPYQTFQEMVAADPRCRPGGLLQPVEDPGVGRHLVASSPLRFELRGAVPPGPSPTLGQHTEEILRHDLELEDKEVRELRRKGLIG